MDSLANSNPAAYKEYMDRVRGEAKGFFEKEYPKVEPAKVYSFRLASPETCQSYAGYVSNSKKASDSKGGKKIKELVRELSSSSVSSESMDRKNTYLYVNLCGCSGSDSSSKQRIRQPDWRIPLSEQILDLIASDVKCIDPVTKKQVGGDSQSRWPDLKVDLLAHPMVIERMAKDRDFALAFEYLMWDSLQAELKLKLIRGSCTEIPVKDNYLGDFEWVPEKILMNEISNQMAAQEASEVKDLDELIGSLQTSKIQDNNDGSKLHPKAADENATNLTTLKLPNGSKIEQASLITPVVEELSVTTRETDKEVVVEVPWTRASFLLPQNIL